MKTYLHWFLLLLLIVWAPVAAAETVHETPAFEELKPVEDIGDDHFTWQLLQMFATLGILLVAVLVLSWIVKKMLNTRQEQMNVSSELKIIERRPLSTKTVLYFLEVRDKELVIAESINGVTLLREFKIEKD